MWGVADVHQLMASMTPEQLDFWIVKHSISPIGTSGLVELLAVIGAAMLSSEDKPLKADDLKRACSLHGGSWLPIDASSDKPVTGQQIKAMFG